MLPRSRAEDQRFRRQLRKGLQARWRRFLVQENKRRQSDPPDVYSSTSAGPEKTEDGFRLVWRRSSQKASSDAQAREISLRRAEAELFSLASRINTRELKSRASILNRAHAIVRNHQCKSFIALKRQPDCWKCSVELRGMSLNEMRKQ